MKNLDDIKIIEVVNNHKESIVDTCSAVVNYINSIDDDLAKKQFKYFFETFSIDEMGSDNVSDYIKPLIDKSASNEIFRLESRIVSTLIKKNIDPDSYYEELLEKLNDESLFPDNESKILFFACLWIDSRTPYYQIVQSCEMEDEEFRQYLAELRHELKKADFYINRGSLQRTQQASLLMDIAEEISDAREKAVFWAEVMRKYAIRFAYSLSKKEDSSAKE